MTSPVAYFLLLCCLAVGLLSLTVQQSSTGNYKSLSAELQQVCDIVLNRATGSLGGMAAGLQAMQQAQGVSVESCHVDGLTLTSAIVIDTGSFMQREVCEFQLNVTGYSACSGLLGYAGSVLCAAPATKQACAVRYNWLGAREKAVIACATVGLAAACAAAGVAAFFLRKRQLARLAAADDQAMLVA